MSVRSQAHFILLIHHPCLHLCHPQLPNAYHSSRHHNKTSGMARKGEARGNSRKAFPCMAHSFFQWRKNVWGGSNRLFLLSHMTRPTCKGCWESNYLAFPASILERGNSLGMACIRLCIYMCVCGIYTYIYTHICVYTYICSLFLMGKDSCGICMSLGA